MISPLTISMEVACPPDHAFATWTARIGTWWPSDHTVSGDPTSIVFESGVGGRIYECDADGATHEWGEVTRWSPPHELGYRWHLGTDPDEATEVVIRFTSRDDGSTHVDIEHRGWERLGSLADARRDRNRAGWQGVLPHFAAAIEEGAP